MMRVSGELTVILTVVAGAALGGYWTGQLAWWLVGGLAFLVLRQVWQMLRFRHWVRMGGDVRPVGGTWHWVADEFQRLRKQSKKRKKRLSLMLQRFQESTMALPYGTITVGADGEIEWFNRMAGQLIGLDPRRDKGRRITHLVRYPGFVEYVNRGEFEEPIVIPSPIDESVEMSVRLVPFGKKQLLITLQDVTRERRLETMRKDFVANVSHELRTPLTVLTGYLEALSDHAALMATDRDQHTVKQMQDQADRMRRIIEDLLLLSRLETSDVCEEDFDLVPVPALLADIAIEAEVVSKGRGHVIGRDVDDSVWIEGDSKELYSAFSNLVSNAVRYSPEGGKVLLRWYLDDDGAHFLVRDQGIGIAPQHLQRLTERFYRVDKDRSRGTGGTGLGLAIVKHVLQRHGASLSIESEVGAGSTFRCDFPPARVMRRPDSSQAMSA